MTRPSKRSSNRSAFDAQTGKCLVVHREIDVRGPRVRSRIAESELAQCLEPTSGGGPGEAHQWFGRCQRE